MPCPPSPHRAIVIFDGAIGQFDRAIGLISPITQNQETAVPCPYKLGDSYIPSGDRSFWGRETALPCPPSPHRAIVIFDRAIRSGDRVNFTHYPKSGDGSAVSLQIG
ncbi:hypothetical protein [Tychonema sp. LEGE 06208]|uniref:hypothetical protein n=1 Tax=Tychonema sp. LEGE 06208 TaxID=1828663 RepID=UPI00187F2E4A|nr:hypothetical protein [Tychonema sp. LEGE 06208]MBE9162593.1 hypothetical protein [Tychonema sp. LEGE 06208]